MVVNFLQLLVSSVLSLNLGEIVAIMEQMMMIVIVIVNFCE